MVFTPGLAALELACDGDGGGGCGCGRFGWIARLVGIVPGSAFGVGLVRVGVGP